MIGIQFELENKYGSFLKNIFKNIHTQGYTWYLPYGEVLNSKGDFFFVEDQYDNLTFKNLIKKEYYIIHLNLLGYEKGKDDIVIKSYGDFMNSSCELLISIVDTTFVRIFCKKNNFLEIIADNAKKNNFKNINFIYPIGDYKKFFEESLF